MITSAIFKKLALSFPSTEEGPHFENLGYKVQKKIFVTLNEKERRCCVKFTPEEQSLFCLIDKNLIYPVPNKWGKQGWTLVNLDLVGHEMLKDILTAAYCTVAPKKLAQPYLDKMDQF